MNAKTILVTGAGGSVGGALALRLAALCPQQLLLLDNSEQGLYRIDSEISKVLPPTSYSAIIGDICDEKLLRSIFRQFGPPYIFHAAAFKHVPLMERNPLAALQNNAVGTYKFARFAREWGAQAFVLVSTDKAVEPISVMGASKRIAEIALSTLDGPGTRMTSVRLGNILGSYGSVVPLFAEQIRRGGPVTVTHPEVSRYFFSISQAVELIIAAAEAESGGILVPQVGEPVKILELARQMISDADSQSGIEIVFTGLRAGDKLSERFLSGTETVIACADPRFLRVVREHPSSQCFDRMMEILCEALERNDIPATLDAVQLIVPEYRPSASLAPACPNASV